MMNFDFIPEEKQNKMYYYIDSDLMKFSWAWCYIVYSKRGPGKTYSVLDLCRRSDIKFVYLKRTMEDVHNLCAGSGTTDTGTNKSTINLSPFTPINRDKGTNIRCFEINKGIAGFYEVEFDAEKQKYFPKGEPLGYAFAVTGIAKYKGFNLDNCDVMIYDEFIPQLGERVSRTEGFQVLSFYDTVTRDRIERGLPEIKLICLANATQVSNQLFDTLELIDEVVDMEIKRKEYYINEYRGIMIHKLPEEKYKKAIDKAKTGIERAMEGTRFAQVEYSGDFAYDNLCVINKPSLREYRPICDFLRGKTTYYVYKKGGDFYVSKIKHDKKVHYDLNNEVDAHKFWVDYGFDMRLALFEDHISFESYSGYNIIYNYKKLYNVT